jgi:hypothetical protein
VTCVLLILVLAGVCVAGAAKTVLYEHFTSRY